MQRWVVVVARQVSTEVRANYLGSSTAIVGPISYMLPRGFVRKPTSFSYWSFAGSISLMPFNSE